MKNWKRKLIPASLAMMVMMSPAVFAAEASNAAKGTTSQAQSGDLSNLLEKRAKLKLMRHEAMKFGPHREMYFLLLAEKYTPEDLDEWQAAFDERERLVREWKDLNLKDKWQEKKEALRENLKSKREELSEKVKNGELTREEAKALMKKRIEEELGEFRSWKEEKKEDLKPILEARKELHEEFTKAIEAKDEEKIASLLPKLLQEFEKVNDQLAKKLELAKQSVQE